MSARIIIIDLNCFSPCFPAVCGFNEKHIRVCCAVALVAPANIDIAAIRGIADIASGYRQAVGSFYTGDCEIPATRLLGNENIFPEAVPAVGGFVEMYPSGSSLRYINFAVGSHTRNGTLDR